MIKFIDKSHQYFSDDGRELISVSKLVKKFQVHKDWKKIARLSAAKKTKNGEPTTAEELLKKWEVNNKFSADVGTLFHSIKEEELLSQNQPIFFNEACNIKKCGRDENFKYSIPINRLENNTVYAELMIYDEEYMVCGQSDKVVVVDNRINIMDYKTDKEIPFNAYQSKFEPPEKFLPPISHLDYCRGNEYSLKMSLYMYMLWKSNRGRLRPGKLIIEHAKLLRDPDKDDLPILVDGKPVVNELVTIELPYLKNEVISILKTLK